MSKYIVDIHGEIDGDYDIICKYVEPKKTEPRFSLSELRDNGYITEEKYNELKKALNEALE